MRQLNKAVNAWGSLGAPPRWCERACRRVHVCFTSTGDLKAGGKALVPHTQQIFLENKDTEQKRMTNAATKAKK